mmetsp:Transcript_2263/g.4177  ORF Transcript_2263/g.4177 Transcript_2263/m.4177 type:complete len:237 (+) Transcript_2263:270-980(+)
MIERPLFRHLHVRMLDKDKDPLAEGSGTMLFQTLKCILMLIPQSACFNVLRDRLVSTSRFRQAVIANSFQDNEQELSKETALFVSRVVEVRRIHCQAIWETIRAESLESMTFHTIFTESKDEKEDGSPREEGADRREWLGYDSVEDEKAGKARYEAEKQRLRGPSVTIEEVDGSYNEFSTMPSQDVQAFLPNQEGPMAPSREAPVKAQDSNSDNGESKDREEEKWKNYWSTGNSEN